MLFKIILLFYALFCQNIFARKDNAGTDFGRRDVLQTTQQVECATGCPASCAPTCKPSCCFPQYFQQQQEVASSTNLMSPGHRAAGRCSPTCALFWTQNILDSISGLFQSVPCPSVCSESTCCQPTQEYALLASRCPSKCAPTYQENCCRSALSAKPQPIEQKPAVYQNQMVEQESPTIRYIPCSAFCAPKFTQECCEKSTVLAPIRV